MERSRISGRKILEKLDVKRALCFPRWEGHKDTASCTLKRVGRTAIEKEWLREFAPRINRPDRADKKNDFLGLAAPGLDESGEFFPMQNQWWKSPVFLEARRETGV